MAEEVSNLSGKVGLDTTDFKSGISTLNRDIRVLESGFKAAASGMENWTKDATGLETRIKTLNSQIDLQKQKVALLAAEHQRVATEEGANSKAAQDLEIRVNQATGVLNKMQLELGQDRAALEDVRSGGQEAGKGLDEAAKKGVTLKDVLGGVKKMAEGLKTTLSGVATVIRTEFAAAVGVLKVGVGAVVGIGAAALATGALVAGLGFKAATAADQLGELADKTGISITQLQQYSYIGSIIGTDLDTITGANARMIRSMASATDGTGAQAEAFQALGVKVKDGSGNLRDSNVVFGELLDALGKIENPTQRDALAMAIFGKSAQELNPLINAGSSGMAAMSRQASELGAIVSDKTVVALGDLRDNFDRLKLGLQGFGTTLLGAFAPLGNDMLEGARDLLKEFILMIKVGDTVDLGKIPEALGKIGTRLAQGLADAMPAIAQTGVEIVTALAASFASNLPALLQAGRDILTVITDAIVQNLPAIADAAPAIIEQIGTALLDVLPLLMGVGAQILLTIVNVMGKTLPGLLPQMKSTGLGIITGLLAALRVALPVIAELAPQILQTLIDFLTQNVQMLIDVGVPMIVGLINALLPALPLLVDAALQILVALANALALQMPVLMPVIEQVVVRIVEILASNAPLLITAAGALIVGLLNGLRAGMPTLIALMPELIRTLAAALINSAGALLVVGAQLLGAVFEGWRTYFSLAPGLIRDTASELLKNAGVGLSFMSKLAKSWIDGLVQGWKDNWGKIWDTVTGSFDDLMQWIHENFQWFSPSGVFADLGRDMVLGLDQGFTGTMADTQRRMQAALGSYRSGASTVVAGGSSTDNSQQFQFYSPVIIQGDTPAGSLGATLKARRF